MPPCLDLGLGEIAEEFRDALIVLGLLTLEHPQGRAADDRILRRARHVRPIRQHGRAGLGLEIGHDAEPGGGGGELHPAFLRDEFRVGRRAAAAIVEQLGLLPFGELADVLDLQGGVDFELGAEPGGLRSPRDAAVCAARGSGSRLRRFRAGGSWRARAGCARRERR